MFFFSMYICMRYQCMYDDPNLSSYCDVSNILTPPMSRIQDIWVGGGGVGVGGGWEPKAGDTIHWNRNRVVVSSTKHGDSHSPHVRPRRLSAAV